MAVIQVNTPGMAATDEGYISSVTIRTAGGESVIVPDASTGQITVSALAATKLVQDHSHIKLIIG